MTRLSLEDLQNHIQRFSLESQADLFGRNRADQTMVDTISLDGREVPVYINEFWTAGQRQACSLHEVSYRACFKPQLPRFFIELLTRKGDMVYDPFSGRGTTAVETGLKGRVAIANDINPLSKVFSSARFCLPKQGEIEKRLAEIEIDGQARAGIDLSMFYHPGTEAEIVSLRSYLGRRKETGLEDDADRWIRMVATNRLTGHSKGFFSVYTLPPNQAVTQEKQKAINARLGQTPEYRDTKKLILKKTRNLLARIPLEERVNLEKYAAQSLFLENDARNTPEIEDNSVQLTVTSPPFLDIVQYSADNWLRCWFNDVDHHEVSARITMSRTVRQWSEVMTGVFDELYRITRPKGWVAFEVGEVKKGKIKLDNHVVPLGLSRGFACAGILINSQSFTKTSNIWGVSNNKRGTNTNRIVMFQKN